jgi:hypothetical protein
VIDLAGDRDLKAVGCALAHARGRGIHDLGGRLVDDGHDDEDDDGRDDDGNDGFEHAYPSTYP